jgi:hypothetical protein
MGKKAYKTKHTPPGIGAFIYKKKKLMQLIWLNYQLQTLGIINFYKSLLTIKKPSQVSYMPTQRQMKSGGCMISLEKQVQKLLLVALSYSQSS